jgi:hypothetical protein
MLPDSPAYGLPGLHRRLSGHRAGVDDHQVPGRFLPRIDPADILELLGQRVGFTLIDPAPEGDDGKIFFLCYGHYFNSLN